MLHETIVINHKKAMVENYLKYNPHATPEDVDRYFICIGGIGHGIGPSFKEIAEKILKEKEINASI